MPLINTCEPTVDVHRSASQVEGDGDCNSGSNLWTEEFAFLSQIFEKYIAAEGNAHEKERLIRVLVQQPVDNEAQVLSLAGMIESSRAIHFAAARAEDQQIGCPSPSSRLR
jgi:hypothetical protein